jgi:hypothetical protein
MLREALVKNMSLYTLVIFQADLRCFFVISVTPFWDAPAATVCLGISNALRYSVCRPYVPTKGSIDFRLVHKRFESLNPVVTLLHVTLLMLRGAGVCVAVRCWICHVIKT